MTLMIRRLQLLQVPLRRAIDENSGAGQVVYTATADDSAMMLAGVTFSLAGSDAALDIDSATGAVTLSTNPDYEAAKPI